MDIGVLEEISDLVAPPLTKEEPELNVFKPITTAAPPNGATIYAVDWSGGSESNAFNSKIRYARWEFATEGSSVTVLPATLSRHDILQMIRTTPGLWIVDFPSVCP